MSAKFNLKKSGNDQYCFNLKAANGEVILSSETYTAKASAANGIASVRANAPQDAQYERKTAADKSPYFVLKSINHEIIGTSEMYSSTEAMEAGITAVKTTAPGAETHDQTGE